MIRSIIYLSSNDRSPALFLFLFDALPLRQTFAPSVKSVASFRNFSQNFPIQLRNNNIYGECFRVFLFLGSIFRNKISIEHRVYLYTRIVTYRPCFISLHFMATRKMVGRLMPLSLNNYDNVNILRYDGR